MRPDDTSDDPSDAPPDGVSRVSLTELIAARIEARRLGLRLVGPVAARRSGAHLSGFRGPGVEYDETRGYVPGDDPRTMDWRVTARAAKPHVKVYREERERPVWLFVDQGPSMQFGTRVAFKSVVAARAAALLGWMAIGHGDRVGGLVRHAGRVRLHPPAGRERGLLPLLRILADAPPMVRSPRASDAPLAPFMRAFGGAFGQVRPGSLVFLISDFAGMSGDDGAWLMPLTAHSEVTLIFVHDPIEAIAPPAGLWSVGDDLGQRRLLDLRSAGRRAAYEQRFAQHRQWLADLARRQRAHWLALATDKPVGPALVGVGAGPVGAGH